MHGLTLLQRSAQSPMQAVLEVQLSSPEHDMGEQIAVEGRILFEEGFQIQRAFGGHQLIEPHLMRRDSGPLLLDIPVFRVWPSVTDALENHPATLDALRHWV